MDRVRGGEGMDRIAVLVVDDEEQVRTFLAELLGSSGYQVRSASSGSQALEMLSGCLLYTSPSPRDS